MSFSVTIDNTKIFPVIYLKDNVAKCEAEIFAFGALLNAFTINSNNKLLNVVDGFNSVEEATTHITQGFKSAKLSPFVCRLKHGTYCYQQHAYTIQKFYLPPHAIHGIVYDAVYTIVLEEADEHRARVVLQYQYTGFDKGFPFKYDIEVQWQLMHQQQLQVSTTVHHNNAEAIPFADGWHPYFTLGDNSIDECLLQLNTHQLIEFDETLIPTGTVVNDYRFENEMILQDIQLDHCYLLNANKHQCILKNNLVQLTIKPSAAYPFVQVYTPPHRKSIAIENLSAAPDAFNNLMGLLLLQPNKKHVFTTTYQVSLLS